MSSNQVITTEKLSPLKGSKTRWLTLPVLFSEASVCPVGVLVLAIFHNTLRA